MTPRDLLAQAYQDNGDLGAAGYIRSGHDLTPDTQIALLAIKDALTLSPQTLPAPGEVERPTEEQLGDWLVENCGKGIPHGEATDRAGMLHGLAYVLRQIEGTNSYKVHIGQCNSATSAIRMALNHFAREALATVAVANDEGVARIIDPYAWRCYDATLRPFQENRGAHEGESWHVRAYQAGCRSADDARLWWRETASDVEPHTVQQFRDSLAKAAAIRLLSQGGGKA